MDQTLFIDPGRCIGCQACVAACRECDSHRGRTMIHLDYVDEGRSGAAMPTVCMHCEDPVAPCAQVLAASLNARVAMVAVIIVCQLWALTAALDSWLGGEMDAVWWLLAFQAVAFVSSLLIWLASPRS